MYPEAEAAAIDLIDKMLVFDPQRRITVVRPGRSSTTWCQAVPVVSRSSIGSRRLVILTLSQLTYGQITKLLLTRSYLPTD